MMKRIIFFALGLAFCGAVQAGGTAQAAVTKPAQSAHLESAVAQEDQQSSDVSFVMIDKALFEKMVKKLADANNPAARHDTYTVLKDIVGGVTGIAKTCAKIALAYFFIKSAAVFAMSGGTYLIDPIASDVFYKSSVTGRMAQSSYAWNWFFKTPATCF